MAVRVSISADDLDFITKRLMTNSKEDAENFDQESSRDILVLSKMQSQQILKHPLCICMLSRSP